MKPMDYTQLSDLSLMQLCVWREARGEGEEGWRGIAHVIRNRSLVSAWWNRHILGSIQRVVLQPYQFSSFNVGDPNGDKWPGDDDTDFWTICHHCMRVWMGADPDNTNGATHYFDTSITWPKAWGDESFYINTLNIAKLRFFKLKSPDNHTEVQDAATST